MRRSMEHVLTTHTGSLPRPGALLEALQRRDHGDANGLALEQQIRDAVDDVVRRQAQAGVSVVNDGEASKIGYSTYVKERLDGFGGEGGLAGMPADRAMTRHMNNEESLDDFRRRAKLHVEAINHATRDIPAEDMRMHLCWGNYEGPHHYDVPLRDIIDIVLEARPAAISFEAANPRHEHEWSLFADLKLPERKILIPGVIDSTTNYIEHPELVSQRLVRYAKLVGRENVIAGSDCGFATFASFSPSTPGSPGPSCTRWLTEPDWRRQSCGSDPRCPRGGTDPSPVCPHSWTSAGFF